MSYQLGKRDPQAIAQALAQAVANKEALAETTHASMGYANGSPVGTSDPQFAGNAIAGHLGINGEFAVALRSPQGQANVMAFEEQLYNGPFSLLPPPIM